MSDLREALEQFDAMAAKWPNSALANQRTIRAAAGKWLAVSETESRSWCATHNLTANGTRCRDFTISSRDCEIVTVIVIPVSSEGET